MLTNKTMTNLTVDLPTAKKLKELWWNKECEYVWHVKVIPWWPANYDWPYVVHHRQNKKHAPFVNAIEAPTAQELLDVLPRVKSTYLEIIRISDTYQVSYKDNEWKNYPITEWEIEEASNLSNALAHTAIRCVENNYLSFKKNDDQETSTP